MSSCDVSVLFPNPEALLSLYEPGSIPPYMAINRGGPYGFDTQSKAWAIADDPLKVPGCKLCLVKFLDGSPVAVRYRERDIIYNENWSFVCP